MSNNKQWLYGDYSPTVNETLTITPVQGLGRLGKSLAWASGCDNLHCDGYSAGDVKKAVGGADVIFVCLGTGNVCVCVCVCVCVVIYKKNCFCAICGAVF